MRRDTQTSEQRQALLDFTLGPILDRDPTDEQLLDLLRLYHLRRAIGEELVINRHPTNDHLIRLMQELHGHEDLRLRAWERLKKRRPPLKDILKVLLLVHGYAGAAADELIARNTYLDPDDVQAILRHAPSRMDAVLARLPAAAETLDVLCEIVARFSDRVRAGEPVEDRLTDYWTRLLAKRPKEGTLAHIAKSSDHPMRVAAWHELKARYPDSPELRNTFVCDELKPLVAEEIVRARKDATKEQLLWVACSGHKQSDRAWKAYLKRGPTVAELIRVIQDHAGRRMLAWKVLLRRNPSVHDLCMLMANAPDGWHERIWRRLRTMVLTNDDLRNVCADQRCGEEAARMLLARDPNFEDLTAIATRVPSLRGEVRERFRAVPPELHELAHWARELDQHQSE